tara:strand:- start:300 stop:623 length:324 start_codon:yes stop_codon:yes gene_type:complete
MAINSQIKARSITSKASSACKINMGLVNGENMMRNHSDHKNYAALTAKKFDIGGGDTTIDREITIGTGTESPEDKAKREAAEKAAAAAAEAAKEKKKQEDQKITIKE